MKHAKGRKEIGQQLHDQEKTLDWLKKEAAAGQTLNKEAAEEKSTWRQ